MQSKVSLISRGSEILRRYMHEEAIDPAIMGYSMAGVVDAAGSEAASAFSPATAWWWSPPTPSMSYRISTRWTVPASGLCPTTSPLRRPPFCPLPPRGVTWAQTPGIRPSHTVVIMGQGLVGNLVLQAARQHLYEQLIVVDAIESRCQRALDMGADCAINVTETDVVRQVLALTAGRGADIVFECVGGQPGLRSFAQAQEMLRDGGTLHLIGLYHGQPLPLDASKIQRRRLLGGIYGEARRSVMLARTIELVQGRACPRQAPDQPPVPLFGSQSGL